MTKDLIPIPSRQLGGAGASVVLTLNMKALLRVAPGSGERSLTVAARYSASIQRPSAILKIPLPHG
jgi:hypothetical protein